MGGGGGRNKTEMGSVDPHFMDNNVLVYVQGDVSVPLVFELTLNRHMKDVDGRVFTVTA